MKKILLGLIVGLVLAIPVSVVYADWSVGEQAHPLIGAECSNSYNGNGRVDCNVSITKFNDGGDTCFVATGGTGDNIPSISCVRYEK